MSITDFITVAEYSNSMDAHLARLSLESEGIRAVVLGDILPYSGVLSEMNAIELQVPSESAAKAREILETLERKDDGLES